jgi:hypothetical protein
MFNSTLLVPFYGVLLALFTFTGGNTTQECLIARHVVCISGRVGKVSVNLTGKL